MLIRTLAAGALLAFAAAPSLPQSRESAAGRAFAPIEDIEWSYGEKERSGAQRAVLQFTRKGGQMSSFDETEASAMLGELAITSLDSPGETVSFAVRREAGLLSCGGAVVAMGSARGTCRFDPDTGFAGALRQRGIAPEDSEKLLMLALVDARLATVDGLLGSGFAIDDVDLVVAISALEITPDFARSLRQAGLVIDDTDNLIAAKAVGIDPAWLRGMADAGYANLEAERAIQMRALDITPDYAQRMKRVLAALEESPSE